MECEKCKLHIDYRKPYGEDLPELLEYDHPDCDGKFRQVFDSAPVFSIAEGSVGNTANGFTKTFGSYNPSPLTPLNKAYGKYGRYTMFDDKGRA